MDKPILPLTYDRIDQWIVSLQPVLDEEGFACAIGILRGGAQLALMISHAMGLPCAFLRYTRATRTVTWDSSTPMPMAGSNVLLCEDIAGAGYTLADCIGFLEAHGLAVKTMTVAFDDLSRIQPDYGLDGRGYFPMVPWERHAHTDSYRARWQETKAGTLGTIGEDHEFCSYAIDLDGVLLPDLPLHRYETDLTGALAERDALTPYDALPRIDFLRTKAIVTGRPEMDRARTTRWLAQHGFDGPHLIMREPARYGDTPEEVSAHKAAAAIALACTHFIESDPAQAIFIAQYAPLLRVIWWDAGRKTAKLIATQVWQMSTSRLPQET